MLRFALWTVVALLVLAVGTVVVAARISREEALRDARVRAGALARIVTGQVTPELRAGEEHAVARMTATMEPRLRRGSLIHAKFWSADGRVLWSDEPGLIGRRFELEEKVTSLFGTGQAISGLSELEKAENAEEQVEDHLLEV